MARIGIYYGSTTGNTAAVAEHIRHHLDPAADVFDVRDSDPGAMASYDLLILGCPTWGEGELRDDWEAFVEHLEAADMSGRKVALFGLGDQESFPDSFVDAMGILYQKVKSRGAEVIGRWPAQGYRFSESMALEGDHFVGLAIDEDNEADKTPERVVNWIHKIKEEF